METFSRGSQIGVGLGQTNTADGTERLGYQYFVARGTPPLSQGSDDGNRIGSAHQSWPSVAAHKPYRYISRVIQSNTLSMAGCIGQIDVLSAL